MSPPCTATKRVPAACEFLPQAAFFCLRGITASRPSARARPLPLPVARAGCAEARPVQYVPRRGRIGRHYGPSASALPQNHFTLALLTFNVGVEAGQLMVVSAAYAL